MQIDLNADLGEGCGDDEAVIRLVSSANISCGAHAGSDEDILRALIACQRHQVVVGAHPSYPDRAGFGRTRPSMSDTALRESLQAQLAHFQALAQQAGVRVCYVKPHGALYNEAAVDAALAMLLAEVIAMQPQPLAVLTLPGSELAKAARAIGLAVFSEAFADRGYLITGQLVPRSQPGALLDEPGAFAQSLQLIQQGFVTTVDQQRLPLEADSLCLHGDSPSALQLATQLRQGLVQAGVTIKAFVN